jgi:hypothetical protein
MSTKIKHTTQISPDHVEHGVANNVTDTDEGAGNAYEEATLNNGSVYYNITSDKLKAKIDGTTRVIGEDVFTDLEPVTDATYNTGESIGVSNALKLIYLTHLKMKPVAYSANFGVGTEPVVFVISATPISASPIAPVGSLAIKRDGDNSNMYLRRTNSWLALG